MAVALIAYRAAGSGLSAGPDDPVSPLVVAAFTLVGALVVSFRALTQDASLGETSLRCRNVLSNFEVEWARVESLEVRRRLGLVIVEVRIRGLRRRHRLGAATRFAGHESEAVLDVLRAHPSAGMLLIEDPAA